MIVTGLDPGETESAIVMFDGTKIHYAAILDNPVLLEMLRRSKTALAGKLLVIEQIGHYGTGMPAGKSVFDTCQMIGRIVEIGEGHGANVQLVLRATIKAQLCHSAKATDANVSQALKDKYGEQMLRDAKIVKHLWAALAVADYALTTRGR